MRVIRMWTDLAAFGIVPVMMTHGRSAYRWPFDVTARGKLALEAAFDVPSLALHDPCFPGPLNDPHVGSIMLAEGMLPFVALFALLNDGAVEVFSTVDRRWWGLYRDEPHTQKEMFLEYYRDNIVSHFACGRTKFAWLSDYGRENTSE